MTFDMLKRRIVEDGKNSIRRAYSDGPKREGGMRGFDIVALLNSMEDLAACIVRRHKAEETLRQDYRDKKISRDRFWSHRYATLQVQYAYEVFKVALGIFPQSARAALHYAKLVGAVRPPDYQTGTS